jgi:molybdate transport system substrate-binding protein
VTRAVRIVVALLLLVGCDSLQPAPGRAAREDRVVVFAAASLRSVFAAIGSEFERTHGGTVLEFNFAGTQELRRQIEQGAEADVFASADQRHMSELVGQALVGMPVVFAKNEPALAVALDSACQISTFADLSSAERIIIGAPEVPIGRYTLQILARAGASLGERFRARCEAHVISRELNVHQIYSKVRLGEADVGVVYRTDVQAADTGVRAVSIPSELNVVAEYPMAVVVGASHPALAQAWIETVTSDGGRRILQEAGFVTP